MDNSDRDAKQRLHQLDAALGELNARLAGASQTLDADRRGGWLEALDALWRFLDRLVRYDMSGTKIPIATLMAALQDLDRGTVNPGLRPKRKSGRPPDDYDQAVIHAIAAAWMHFLLEAGRRRAAAAQAIARVLIKQRVPLGQQTNVTTERAGRTVAKWRERLEEGGDHPRAVERYRFFKEKYRYPSGTSAESIEAEFPKLLSEAIAGRNRESD
jgi:hypothetical protein